MLSNTGFISTSTSDPGKTSEKNSLDTFLPTYRPDALSVSFNDATDITRNQKTNAIVTGLNDLLELGVRQGVFYQVDYEPDKKLYTLNNGCGLSKNVEKMQFFMNLNQGTFEVQGSYIHPVNGNTTFNLSSRLDDADKFYSAAADLKNTVYSIVVTGNGRAVTNEEGHPCPTIINNENRFDHAVQTMIREKGGVSYGAIKRAIEAEEPVAINRNTRIFKSEVQAEGVNYVANMFKSDPILASVSENLKTPLLLGIETVGHDNTAKNYHLKSGSGDQGKDYNLITFNPSWTIEAENLYAKNKVAANGTFQANAGSITLSTAYNELSEINSKQMARASGKIDYTSRAEIQELNKGVTDYIRAIEQDYINDQVAGHKRSIAQISPKEMQSYIKSEISLTPPSEIAEYMTIFYNGSSGYPNKAIDSNAPVAVQLEQAKKIAKFYNSSFLEAFYSKGYPELAKVEAVAQQSKNGKGVELIFKAK